jgi:hypothetical protein
MNLWYSSEKAVSSCFVVPETRSAGPRTVIRNIIVNGEKDNGGIEETCYSCHLSML